MGNYTRCHQHNACCQGVSTTLEDALTCLYARTVLSHLANAAKDRCLSKFVLVSTKNPERARPLFATYPLSRISQVLRAALGNGDGAEGRIIGVMQWCVVDQDLRDLVVEC